MPRHAEKQKCNALIVHFVVSKRHHFELRPLPFDLDMEVDVIFEVCMSSPMYLVFVSGIRRGIEPVHLRLQKLVAALELLVFALHRLHSVYDSL